MTVFLAQEVEMTKGNCSYHYDQKNTYVTCTEWLQKVLPSKWDNGPNRPCRPVWPVQHFPFPVFNLLDTRYHFRSPSQSLGIDMLQDKFESQRLMKDPN